MKLLIAFLLASVLGREAAQASRPSGFVNQAVQRMARNYQEVLRKVPSYTSSPFNLVRELENSLGIAWDWDRSVENLFATFGADKLKELATAYGIAASDDGKKESLYNSVLFGDTKIADKMLEMGLDFNELDLQGLLIYALRSDYGKSSKLELRTNWWDWLLQHGASIGNLQVLAKLFKLAALRDDIVLLDWMKDNLFTDTEAAKTILTSIGDEVLPFALRVGAGQAAIWLIKQGADASVLKETDALSFALQGYLVESSQLSLPLAQHASNVDKHSLNDLLLMIANNSSGVPEDISMMEHLQVLGAKLTAQEWQDILHSTLTKSNPNWLMANFVVAQGADINALDLNNIVSKAIEAAHAYNTSELHVRLEPIDIVSLFNFLHIHGADRSKLNVAQLQSIAEEKNVTEAIEQLKNVNKQVEQIPAEEILQQLYAELTPPTTLAYVADSGKDFLLYEAVKDYWDKKSFAWLVLYIGKVRGASTLTDMLVETIRFTPYLGSPEYNEKMDGVFETLGLAKEKEELAQVLLTQIFQSKEIHPFPLSFAQWAVSNGASINHPDQNTVVRAIINNQEMMMQKDAFRSSLSVLFDKEKIPPKEDYPDIRIPFDDAIIFFLEDSGFHFNMVNNHEVMRITEASDAAIILVLGGVAREKR